MEAVAGTKAGIYDTRKTLPGWRALQKYAVRAGGGQNHRMGLIDMVLIKDNHLAGWRAAATDRSVAAASVPRGDGIEPQTGVRLPVEVEVDTLEQLADALAGQPDIVLLDNMTLDELRQAVALRNARASGRGAGSLRRRFAGDRGRHRRHRRRTHQRRGPDALGAGPRPGLRLEIR